MLLVDAAIGAFLQVTLLGGFLSYFIDQKWRHKLVRAKKSSRHRVASQGAADRRAAIIKEAVVQGERWSSEIGSILHCLNRRGGTRRNHWA